MLTRSFLVVLASVTAVLSTPIVYDGRAPDDYTAADLDGSVDPYLTWVLLKF